ncbi:hypothetical protein COV17_03665 [Candidatus Woesearchaeota archaeon CG10_big_fil_rev_8_21_14_0_10_36_11]|nr:MAG: hypothetical protein COV17_03665 [Candidatus Woesearchaeota archaeon CG10_big_fil_rev_8_21_14_0_10_36_11]
MTLPIEIIHFVDEIRNNRYFQREVRFVQEGLGVELPFANFFKDYVPKEEWFYRHNTGVHDISHETRVLVLSEIIGRLVRKKREVLVDMKSIRWAAITHDTQRTGEGSNYEHGVKAAEWVQSNAHRIIPHDCDSRGEEVNIDQVAYLNKWHVPHDSEAPVMTLELSILKDADGLDRVRVGELNPVYLRTEEATRIVFVAYGLYVVSNALQQRDQHQQHHFGEYASVIEAATLLGIVKRSTLGRE